MVSCPFTIPAFLGGPKTDNEKEKEKDTSSKPDSPKTGPKPFPLVAVGGLTLVGLLSLTTLVLAISFIFRFASVFYFIASLPFRGTGLILSTIVWLPIRFLFSILFSRSPVPKYAPSSSLHCNNSMELQGWEVLNLVPGIDGNPKPIQYQLNSPTPHSISIVDIDYRDTRLDIFANGKYYGSTSDFALDKSVYCGEDLNACIQQGFSMGTVVVPPGKMSVEINWSGKDVFPGTDKIVWGGDRKRRVMWKKDLCL